MKTILILFILSSTVSCAHMGHRATASVAGVALDCANEYLSNCCKTEREIGGW